MSTNDLPDHGLPGGELPKAVYRSVVLTAAWMFMAAWLAFGRNGRTDYLLGILLVLGVVSIALPRLIRMTASHHITGAPEDLQHFLHSEVDTATGPMSGGQAWIEIAIIPACLALAATLIGLVYVFSS